MKFSENWLRAWVNPEVNTETLAENLTMAGLEVDSIEPAAPFFDHVVVGQVLSLQRHPDADKLNICEVDVGEDKPLSIICGASNVAKGVKVPAAMIGAELPGGMKIKKAKLRGIESFGMLCSATEVGIAESADGLLILPADAPVGTSIRDYMFLDDQIIEVDFTPNRGDCLSVAGITREIGVLTNTEVNEPEMPDVDASIDDVFEVVVDAATDCPRYLGRVIKGINPKAESPLWLQEHLRRAGLRSLSPTVDVTNYVLLELGQPMHAFDLAKLDEKIIVRRAVKGEKLKLLDDSEIEMDEKILVIADSNKALAFAGVMGGLDSSVTDSTQDIFLESAFFQPDIIRGKARRFGKQTDSSYRFERGVSFQIQYKAMQRATRLILDIAGGQAGPVTEVVNESDFPVRKTIAFRSARLQRVLGLKIDDDQVENILTRLGMSWTKNAEGWDVVAPDYRFDIEIEADLIEEIGRVYGYNNLPVSTPKANLQFVQEPEVKVFPRQIRSSLVNSGYQEAITYSFVDPAIQALLDPENTPIALENPISAEMSVMRTTLWSSLLKTAQHNQARQQNRVRIFEIGKRFSTVNGEIQQETVISGLVTGDVTHTQWGEAARKVDFFDVKHDVENLLSITGDITQFGWESAAHSALHPGQSAMITNKSRNIGWLGALHPKKQQQLGLHNPVFLFELSYTELDSGVLPQFKAVSKFPAIKRDLALVVKESVTAGTVFAIVTEAGGNRLQLVEIFDIYRGKGVEVGDKSLALSLTIQDDSQTLTDIEVDAIIQKILVSLQGSIGATLRE
ncbi:MAG: phenylalanine--tRNA ligase subunit beta [Gammaproteobacteria bacterium]|nr:phenylalanine--tRNA ligase subunit beta [Gammaproteobacteria bacterium]